MTGKIDVRWSEELLQNDIHAAENLRHQEVLGGFVDGRLALIPLLSWLRTEIGLWRAIGSSRAHRGSREAGNGQGSESRGPESRARARASACGSSRGKREPGREKAPGESDGGGHD